MEASEDPCSQIESATEMRISRGEQPEEEITNIEIERVKNIDVHDENGKSIKFEELYKNQKTIVILIRNFLCYVTKEYIDDLAKVPAKYLQDSGVKLIVVGCGPHKFINDFRKATGLKFELYTNPDQELFKKLGCYDKAKEAPKRVSKHVKSSFFTGILKSTWRGMQYREYQGDLDQQGGSFIIGPGNQIYYHHQDVSPEDHTAINDLLAMASVEQVNFDKDKRVLSI